MIDHFEVSIAVGSHTICQTCRNKSVKGQHRLRFKTGWNEYDYYCPECALKKILELQNHLHDVTKDLEIYQHDKEEEAKKTS